MNTATLAQAKQVLNLIEQQQIPEKQMQELLESGLLSDLLRSKAKSVDRNDFRKLLKLTPHEFKILVDYSLSLQEMIAAGHYEWVNSGITPKRFPVNGEGKKELTAELIHFNRDMSTGAVESELKKRNLRPATVEELLAFGKSYPDIQREFAIIAYGSVTEVVGGRAVPFLGRGCSSERSFDLGQYDNVWDDHYRFLAFRN